MKQRIALLTGLTAVSLLILLTSCTTPTTPEAIVATAVSPTPTSQPTATTAPTATPEPTATPTAAEQANQRLLNNGRFTTLLADLTQEIGRDLSDDEQAQVLALARALWLPGQTDASDWRPDPAGVTLHWRPALDGREGPVLRVVETQPDSPYAAGALIFWQGERLLTLTPSQPGFNIEYTTVHKNGQSFSTWVETDVNGELIRFVDNTNPDSDTYLKWIAPQDLDEDGSFSIFMIQDTDPTNGDSEEFWWTNGGEPVRITSAPDGRTLTDYLTANPNHTLSEIDRQLTITDGDTILFALNPETMEWEQAANPAEAFFVQAQELYGEPYGINLDPDVEIRSDGRMTIYSTINGQRVETVRTAINDDGTLHLDENGRPVPLFATEAYALATSRPLEGGNLADRISIYYQPDVPRLDNGRFIILDEARVSAEVDALLNVRSGLPVQNVLSAEQQTKNHLLTDESGTVTVEQVNVIFGRIRNQLPGYRAMYTNFTPTGAGSGINESYGYLWNPDKPEQITIMINYDDRVYTNVNNDGIRNSMLLRAMLKGIALLQSTNRPITMFPRTSINTATDINNVGNDFIWLSIHNEAEGWYRAVDYQVSND